MDTHQPLRSCSPAGFLGAGGRGSGWGGVPAPDVFLQFSQWHMWPRLWVKREESSTVTLTAPQLQVPSIAAGWSEKVERRRGFGCDRWLAISCRVRFGCPGGRMGWMASWSWNAGCGVGGVAVLVQPLHVSRAGARDCVYVGRGWCWHFKGCTAEHQTC
jgi:hypothetical protein